MNFITYQQYITYLKNNHDMKLQEKEVVYEISRFVKKRSNQKQEQTCYDILSKKREMVKFLNHFFNVTEKIKEKQLIRQMETMDIIYKLTDKPVYFFVQHQRNIDHDILEKIWKAVGEIMRKESIVEKTYLKKDKIYPVVVPIVIYTGFQKWKINKLLEDKNYQLENVRKTEINWIYIQDYTFEQLLDKKSLFASFMIAEKSKIFLANIVQNLIESEISDNKIIKYTGMNKEELKKIKNYIGS